MRLRHTQTHELEFENGDKVAFVYDGETVEFKQFKLPVREIGEFAMVLGALNGQQRVAARKGRHSPIAPGALVRWNRRWRKDPSTSIRAGSWERKVVVQAFRMARAPITRGALTTKIATTLNVKEDVVRNIVSRMIHSTRMLEVVQETRKP